jgi:hypothetical protein
MPSRPKSVSRALHNAGDLARKIDGLLDGVEIRATERNRLAAACLDTAMEHHKAIIVLTEKALYGSAHAMLRMVFEAFVRGTWLHHCATDDQIRKFIQGKSLPSFQDLLNSVETTAAYESGILSQAKQNAWGAMCGFTHTGFSQVARRITDEAIEPCYDDDEILQVLSFSNAIAILASIESASVANNSPLAVKLLETCKVHASKA